MRDLLFAEAVLGRDAQEFLNSELGRYLTGMCENEEKLASEELSRVSPWRRNRIRQLQNEIWRARSVRQWLGEIIQAGKQAEHSLEDHEDD